MSKELENNMSIKSMEILLNKYKKDNEKLLKENQKLERYKKKFIGFFLIFLSVSILIIGAVFFIANFQFILLSFFAIALFSFAVFLIFIYSPKTHHLDLLNSVYQTVSLNLINTLSKWDLENYSVFLPTNEKVFQFIPFHSNTKSKTLPSPDELKEDRFEILDKGIILESTGNSILESVINENNIDFSKNDVNTIGIVIQELVQDQLNLVKIIDFIKQDKGRYELIFTGSLFTQHYKFYEIRDIRTRVGCPISCFVAMLLAYNIKRPVFLKSYEINQEEKTATILFELGELYH